MAQIHKHFEPQPWFAGLGIAGLEAESRSRAISESLPIDEVFRNVPEGCNRATGIVVRVLNRSQEQLEEVRSGVTQLLSDIHAEHIPFIVINSNLLEEAIDS